MPLCVLLAIGACASFFGARPFEAIALDAHGTRVAVASGDRVVAFSVEDGRSLMDWHPPERPSQGSPASVALCWTRSAALLYAGIGLYRLDPEVATKHRLVSGPLKGVWRFTPSGRYLLLRSEPTRSSRPSGASYRLLDLRTGRERTTQIRGDWVDIAPASETLFWREVASMIRTVDLATGKTTRYRTGRALGGLWNLAAGPEGTSLLASLMEGRLIRVGLDRTLLSSVKIRPYDRAIRWEEAPNRITVSPALGRVFLAGKDYGELLDPDTGSVLVRVEATGDYDFPNVASFSADGERFAVLKSFSGEIEIYRARSGELVRRIKPVEVWRR